MADVPGLLRFLLHNLRRQRNRKCSQQACAVVAYRQQQFPALRHRLYLGSKRQAVLTHASSDWRKRVGVEPTGDRKTCRPPVLKTGRITGPHALPCLPINGLRFHVSWSAHSLHRPGRRSQSRRSVPRGTFCTSEFVRAAIYIFVNETTHKNYEGPTNCQREDCQAEGFSRSGETPA